MAVSGARVVSGYFSLLGLMAAANAHTATPAAMPDSPARLIEEGLLRETQRLHDHPAAMSRDELHPEGVKTFPAEVAAESACFDIRSIELEGPSSSGFGWLSQHAGPFLNRCLGVQGLGQLVSALDAALLDAGYVTSRVSLLAQNLAQGGVRLHVHAGRIARMEADDGLRWQGAFPAAAGDLLNVRDLEQGMEQMNRLPSQVVQAQLIPGEAADTSVVYIRNRSANGSRLRGAVMLDNSGSPSLGRPQLGMSLALDNPGSLNDLLSVSANTSLRELGPDHRSQSLAVSYSIPWGYSLISASAYATAFAQRIQLTTTQAVSSGQSRGFELRWDRTVHRSRSGKLGLYGALSARRSRSFLDDLELLVQNRRNSFAMLGMHYKRLFRHSSLDGELSVRKGIGWLGAEPDYEASGSNGVTLRPLIWNAGLSFEVPHMTRGGQLGYRMQVRTQYTRNATLTMDQFGIGSRSTVRGFDGASTLVAESGILWRNELAMPIQWGGQPAVAYLGIDLGRVGGRASDRLVGRHLAGVAIGLRTQWRLFSLDAALAFPLAKPRGFAAARVSPYLSVSYLF